MHNALCVCFVCCTSLKHYNVLIHRSVSTTKHFSRKIIDLKKITFLLGVPKNVVMLKSKLINVKLKCDLSLKS